MTSFPPLPSGSTSEAAVKKTLRPQVSRKRFYQQLGIAIASGVGGAIAFSGHDALAQIQGDGTVGTTVNSSPSVACTTSCTIEGGTQAGSNLFHSFTQFSIPTGGEAFFNNGSNIQNIISRITGSSQSNIDGLIRANDTANLFLLNPNGIIFGPNASLTIGGSFVATSANAIQFGEQGSFSTSDLSSSPSVLTVNPSAFLFNQIPGPIINQSTVGLQVQPNQNLWLLGGNVSLDGGVLQATGGRIELGGLAQTGTVIIEDITDDGSNPNLSFPDVGLSFPENLALANVTITNALIDAGNESGFGLPGKISITAGDQIFVTNSEFTSRSQNDLTDDFSVIQLTARTGSITLNQSTLSTSNFGSGFAGDIFVNAADQINIENQSNIFSNGRDGRIFIDANNRVSLKNSKISTEANNEDLSEPFNIIQVSAREGSVVFEQSVLSTNNQGSGYAGDISISARDEIFVLNQSKINSDGNFGRIFIGESEEFSDSLSPRDIKIDDSALTTESSVGRAGEISINAVNNILITNVGLTDEGRPRFSTNSDGEQVNAGNITLQANSSVAIANSIITSEVNSQAIGNAGTIAITANSISLTDASELRSLIFGQGTAGTVTLQTNDGTVSLDNSRIFSTIESGGLGTGGNIRIETGSLSMRNNSGLQTLLRGPSEDDTLPGAQGTAGIIVVSATDSISLSESGMLSTIEEGANGNTGDNQFAGNIFGALLGTGGDIVGSVFVSTGSLSLQNNSELNASTFGDGNAGAVVVLADGVVSLENGSRILSGVASTATGNGGGILLGANSLSITNSSDLTTQTEGQGDAGIILVATDRDISLGDASGIFSTVESTSTGNGGGISLDVRRLFIEDGSQVNVNNENQRSGLAGDLEVVARQDIILRNQGQITATAASGQGGNIYLTAGDFLILLDGSQITTEAGAGIGGGNGGNIFIDTQFIIAAPAKDNNVSAQAFLGDGGRIRVTASYLFDIKERPLFPLTNDMSASSTYGRDGEVSTSVLNVDPTQGLTNLPVLAIDPTTLIAETCAPRRGVAQKPNNQFVVTGRGGLPPDPNAAFPGEAVINEWNTPEEQQENGTDTPKSDNSEGSEAGAIASSQQPPLVEAQGWVYGENGKIIFMAQSPTVTPNSPALTPASTCNAF